MVGRDFSIGCSHSTSKAVSHIMFMMVKLVSQITDDVDKIPRKDKYISIEQLAKIIQSLKNDLAAVKYKHNLETMFVEVYRYYVNDTFDTVRERCESACDLFTNALVNAVLIEADIVYWDYS